MNSATRSYLHKRDGDLNLPHNEIVKLGVPDRQWLSDIIIFAYQAYYR